MNVPHRFDANEWFIITAAVLLYTIIFFLPKRYCGSQIVFIWAFNLFLANLTDLMIATKPLDLYDINDGPDYEIFDLLLYLLLYSPTAYLFIYFYDRWNVRGGYAVWYVSGWAFVTTGLEEIAEWFHVYKFLGWKHLYSIPSYALLYIINLVLFRMFRNLYSAEAHSQ